MKFSRRIILIKRALQMKYVMLVFISVFLTVTIVSLDVYYVLGKQFILQAGEASLGPILGGAARLLGLHLTVYLLVVVIISVFISHKFVGPIFRLERITESIADGDLSVRVSFRKGDELFETAEYLNRMIDSLRDKITKDRNLSARVTEKLTDISLRLKDGSLKPAEASRQLEDLLVEVRYIASEFKL